MRLKILCRASLSVCLLLGLFMTGCTKVREENGVIIRQKRDLNPIDEVIDWINPFSQAAPEEAAPIEATPLGEEEPIVLIARVGLSERESTL